MEGGFLEKKVKSKRRLHDIRIAFRIKANPFPPTLLKKLYTKNMYAFLTVFLSMLAKFREKYR